MTLSAVNGDDQGWVEAIQRRHRSLSQRLVMAGISVIAFSSVLDGRFIAVWLFAFIAIQTLDLWALGPITRGKVHRLPLARHVLACAMMFANAAAFGALGVPMWLEGGVAGGVCALLLWTGAAIFSVINSPGSRLVLVLTVTPQVLFLAATPILMRMHAVPSALVSAATVGVAVHAFFYLNAWSRLDRARRDEVETRLEADRQRNEALRVLEGRTAFLSAVGHDLRTPISAILTGADAVQRGATDGNARSHAQLILDAGEMMKALLDDLLDHAKLEAGHMQVEKADFDLRQMVTQTLRLWRGPARAKGLRLRVRGGAHLPRAVTGDPMRIRQVLNNLISNAMKFTHTGSITLDLRAWPLEGREYALLIDVVDTGPGMTADQMSRLFTPFDQTADGIGARHGGTGLGLAISRQLAELMGGRLTARSHPGQGAVFTLSLVLPAAEALGDAALAPDNTGRGALAVALMHSRDIALSTQTLSAQTQAEQAQGEQAQADQPDPAPDVAVQEAPSPVSAEAEVKTAPEDEDGERPLRVLVVDDHDINRRAIELILQPLGCETSAAADGMSALKLCEAQAYDLVFMDVRMPELDGRETTRRLRAANGLNASTPVIAVTADTSPEDIAACTAAGMDYFVPKPITPATLLGAITHVLAPSTGEADDAEAAA